jgi:hypothetical protein
MVITEIASGISKVLGALSLAGKVLKGGVNSFIKTISKGDIDIVSITLSPINISLIAPSGAGKTTLISTVLWDTEIGLKDPHIEIKPIYKEDEARINTFNNALTACIASGKIEINPNGIIGSAGIAEFHYEIKYERTDAMEKIPISLSQPFTLMDLPGGWLDVDKRQDDGWREYKNHLRQSIALWVPIDSPILKEAKTPDEKGLRSELLKIGDVSKVIIEWAKFRTTDAHKDEPAILCFAPVKCETYFSQAQNKPKIQDGFFSVFLQEYEDLINQVKGICSWCKIYFVPVESIGCIQLNHIDWNIQEKTPKVAYMIRPPHKRKTAGGLVLSSYIYEYGGKRLIDTFGEAIKEKESIDEGLLVWMWDMLSGKGKEKKEQLEAMKSVFESLKILSKELTELAANAKKDAPYFKAL